MYKIVLCDDNEFFLKELQQALEEIFRVNRCKYSIEKLNSGIALLEKIEHEKKGYNIIFLNVNKGESQEFLIAKRISIMHKDCILIFTSNLCDIANEGYKYGAFRWILKSNLKEEVYEAINSIVGVHSSAITDERVIRFKFRHEEEYDYINVLERDIIQLYKKNRRVVLVTLQGDYELLLYTLIRYKNYINSNNFLIVSRSHLINLYHVERLKGDFFQLSNGDTVCLGSDERIKKHVKKYYSIRYKKGAT
ncbi:LytR/AlgR family response regulator transcription factor [Paenibacillus sp. NPDC058177]|uniref:LytR/AlgR family response regulator transcription factor n=1 Tax=Paenibacillus sp. NPDC058177 TaxID=3346369 RepID=UPI0036D7F07B